MLVADLFQPLSKKKVFFPHLIQPLITNTSRILMTQGQEIDIRPGNKECQQPAEQKTFDCSLWALTCLSVIICWMKFLVDWRPQVLSSHYSIVTFNNSKWQHLGSSHFSNLYLLIFFLLHLHACDPEIGLNASSWGMRLIGCCKMKSWSLKDV